MKRNRVLILVLVFAGIGFLSFLLRKLATPTASLEVHRSLGGTTIVSFPKQSAQSG
jgi:hypothetical protein